MVHALYEAWRVLVPQGILFDLRPLSNDMPLEILFSGGCESAGLVDLSPDIEHDIAADQAINIAVSEGIFKELKSEVFDYRYYWNNVEEMKADLDEEWKDDVILPDEVLQRAFFLFNNHPGQSRVRFPLQMKLGKFVKQEPVGWSEKPLAR